MDGSTIVGYNMVTGAPVTKAEAEQTQRLRGGKRALMTGKGIIPWWMIDKKSGQMVNGIPPELVKGLLF